MNLDIILIRIGPPLLHARILRLEAIGGIFLAVDSKFSVQIELFSTKNFSFTIYMTGARITSKCSSTPKLKDAVEIFKKKFYENFLLKNFEKF